MILTAKVLLKCGLCVLESEKCQWELKCMLVIQKGRFQYHRVLVIIIIICIQFLDLHEYFGVQWNESQKELRCVFFQKIHPQRVNPLLGDDLKSYCTIAFCVSNGYLGVNLANASTCQFYQIPVNTHIGQKHILAVYFVTRAKQIWQVWQIWQG